MVIGRNIYLGFLQVLEVVIFEGYFFLVFVVDCIDQVGVGVVVVIKIGVVVN